MAAASSCQDHAKIFFLQCSWSCCSSNILFSTDNEHQLYFFVNIQKMNMFYSELRICMWLMLIWSVSQFVVVVIVSFFFCSSYINPVLKTVIFSAANDFVSFFQAGGRTFSPSFLPFSLTPKFSSDELWQNIGKKKKKERRKYSTFSECTEK